jgi:two-component system chemotaxis response regulator CheB
MEIMMDKNKILIIDDSALMRRVISDIINSSNQFEVADTATDGVEGLDLLIRNNGVYDVVLLDVNMPKMDGLEVLKMVKRYQLQCKVIMVSTTVKEGAAETILALENGAIDFVLKPSSYGSGAMEEFKERLISSITVAVDKNVPAERTEKDSHIVKEGVEKRRSTSYSKAGGDKVVAIACSTGGPKSLKEVIPLLPKNIAAPIVLVQHMPKGFTKSLSDRLNELSEVTVVEAEEGDVLQKGYVYVAPGGKQMRIVHNADGTHSIKVTDEAPREGLRPCANIMYESLLDSSYDDIICVVLTGMGSDGTNGIEKLSKEKNVYVISQDAQTSVVYGMPRAVNNAGLSDEVLPLDKISESIIKNVGVLSDGR